MYFLRLHACLVLGAVSSSLTTTICISATATPLTLSLSLSLKRTNTYSLLFSPCFSYPCILALVSGSPFSSPPHPSHIFSFALFLLFILGHPPLSLASTSKLLSISCHPLLFPHFLSWPYCPPFRFHTPYNHFNLFNTPVTMTPNLWFRVPVSPYILPSMSVCQRRVPVWLPS